MKYIKLELVKHILIHVVKKSSHTINLLSKELAYLSQKKKGKKEAYIF